MGIVAPDPNVEAEAEALGSIVKSKRVRGWIYGVAGGVGVALTIANGVTAYLVANHALGTYPLWLGAVGVAYPLASAAVHALSKANT